MARSKSSSISCFFPALLGYSSKDAQAPHQKLELSQQQVEVAIDMEQQPGVSAAAATAASGGLDAAATDTYKFNVNITCTACAQSVEHAVQQLSGLQSVSVSSTFNSVVVTLQRSGASGPRDVIQAIDTAGFTATLADHTTGPADALNKEAATWRTRFVLGSIFALPVVILGMGGMMVPRLEAWCRGPLVVGVLPLGWMVQAALAAVVQVMVGAPFYKQAWNGFKHRASNMGTLVSLGTSAAFLNSLFIMLMCARDASYIGHVCFESSVMILVLVCLGKCLEAKAKAHASDAVQSLQLLAPQTAELVVYGAPDGKTEVTQLIDTRLLKVNNVVLVKPGSVIPTDGIVTQGSSEVDESMVTGEAMPVMKNSGDTVIGGTVNGLDLLFVRATNVGSQTVLAKIISSVETAEANKAPIQALADKIASWFVPAVTCISAITCATWLVLGYNGRLNPELLPPGTTPPLLALLSAGGL